MNTTKRRSKTLATLSGALLGACLASGSAYAADMPAIAPVKPTPFFFFSDTVLEYRFEATATDPGFSNRVQKEIANVTHVDAYQYGTNFISVDILTSSGADPQNGNAQFVGVGSREVYGIYRGTFSGNAVTKSKAFAFGKIIKDVSFEYGTDLEAQNNAFSPQKTVLLGGLKFDFDTPGVLSLGVHVYKEWNHDALNSVGGFFAAPSNANFNAFNGRQSFNPTAEFEFVYVQPLTFTKLPLTLNGFANVILPKGKLGGGGNSQTEFLETTRLTLDAGSYVGHPKLIDLYVGYKLWLNKFGNSDNFTNASYVAGAHESTFICGMDYHLQ